MNTLAAFPEFNPAPFPLAYRASTLGQRLRGLHERLLRRVPSVDRIACAMYDAAESHLKTFIHSTRHGDTLGASQIRLSGGHSLTRLVQSAGGELPLPVRGGAAHAEAPSAQDYRSSFTAPLYDSGAFAGFIFYSSAEPAAFGLEVQRDLGVFSSLINMTVSSELASIRSTIALVQLAGQIAHLRDVETGAHIERMARYSRLIAADVAASHGLDDEFAERVFLFAPLHDIGKIGIADSILKKPGALDAAERRAMETHVAKGCDLLDKVITNFGLHDQADAAIMRNIVACHHELLDGSGYPHRLAGAAIPLEARIVTVADIFDALTSTRPYKSPWSVKDALAELARMAQAGKLDAGCVAALTRHSAAAAAIIARHQDRDLKVAA